MLDALPEPPPWARRLYDRTRHVQGPVLLVLGGVWDYYTLKLERLADNLLLAGYLLVFAAITVLAFRRDLGLPVPAWVDRRHRALHLAGQFVLGGLLSAYFVHYLRGAPVQRELGWLALLGLLAVANELAEGVSRLPLVRFPLLAFAAFNYLLAVLPLVTGDLVGPIVPLLGAGLLVVGATFASAWGSKLTPAIQGAGVAGLVGLGTQVALVGLDMVPPLPLTLMAAEVQADAEGDLYELDTVRELLAPVGLRAPRLAWARGEVVRVRTPVYLPEGMATTVVHRWARWDAGAWQTSDRIRLVIRGGREEGYRTYSLKRRTVPGWWRVFVETEDGRELGRVSFRLVPPTEEP